MPNEYRIHTFVDFWNYTLNMKRLDASFSTDWKKLPKILTREAGLLIDTNALAIYSGMNVYGSYNRESEKDRRLKNWTASILNTFPGVNAYFKKRVKKKSPPNCPTCHTKVEECPSCGVDMRGTEEKGIDTMIATDLVNLAWENVYDVAVLMSSDQDFVPAAEILQNKGIKVIHAGFHPNGMLLRQKCWGAVNIPDFMGEFGRPR